MKNYSAVQHNTFLSRSNSANVDISDIAGPPILNPAANHSTAGSFNFPTFNHVQFNELVRDHENEKQRLKRLDEREWSLIERSKQLSERDRSLGEEVRRLSQRWADLNERAEKLRAKEEELIQRQRVIEERDEEEEFSDARS